MNKAEIQERLEKQSATTYAAELYLIRCTLDEIDAAEALRDYERRLYLEAGDKEKHPELTNDKKRTGWVAMQMTAEAGAKLRALQGVAYQDKLQAEAVYNREDRFGQHLVALVRLLRPV